MSRYLLPRLREMLFLAIFFAILVLGPRMLSLDSDLGRHLTLGNYILDHQSIPTIDIFSFTKNGEPRPPYEWLSQVFFSLAYRALGFDGVIFLCALVIGAAFMIVYSDTESRSRLPLAALFVTIISVSASSLHWLPRPHIFTFLLLSVWLERLEKLHRGENIPWWHLSLLMLVWVNLHGGFIFGVLAWLAYFSGWLWEKFVTRKYSNNWSIPAISLAFLPMTFVTPSGYGSWQAVLNNNSQYIISHTVETMPVNFAQPGAWPFVFLLVIAVFIFIIDIKSIRIAHIFLLAGFALLGVFMARNIPLFTIAAAPIITNQVSNILKSVSKWKTAESNIIKLNRYLTGGLWTVVFVVGSALFLAFRSEAHGNASNQFNPDVFPTYATDWLVEHPQTGNVFNEFNWGGYLLFRLWPRQTVFIDSQTDFYGEALTRDYEAALNKVDGWQPVFKMYKIEWTIIQPDSQLARSLQVNKDWELIYKDSTAVMFRQKINEIPDQ